MVKAARVLLRRMGFVGALVLAMVLAMPAFESHACAADAGAIQDGVVTTVAAAADHGETCPDCGPACAGACCHAPHVAIAPDPSLRVAPAIARSVEGIAAPRLAAIRPPGPERPPRS